MSLFFLTIGVIHCVRVMRVCLILQVRSRLSVSLMAVTDASPTAATGKSTCMCTHQTSHTSAKCATSHTPTPALSGNT